MSTSLCLTVIVVIVGMALMAIPQRARVLSACYETCHCEIGSKRRPRSEVCAHRAHRTTSPTCSAAAAVEDLVSFRVVVEKHSILQTEKAFCAGIFRKAKETFDRNWLKLRGKWHAGGVQ